MAHLTDGLPNWVVRIVLGLTIFLAWAISLGIILFGTSLLFTPLAVLGCVAAVLALWWNVDAMQHWNDGTPWRGWAAWRDERDARRACMGSGYVRLPVRTEKRVGTKQWVEQWHLETWAECYDRCVKEYFDGLESEAENLRVRLERMGVYS